MRNVFTVTLYLGRKKYLHWCPSFLTVPVFRSNIRPVFWGSCVESCSRTFSTSSGWILSYIHEPYQSLCKWFNTGATESETYITLPVSQVTTNKKPSAASSIRCLSSWSVRKDGLKAPSVLVLPVPQRKNV